MPHKTYVPKVTCCSSRDNPASLGVNSPFLRENSCGLAQVRCPTVVWLKSGESSQRKEGLCLLDISPKGVFFVDPFEL